MLLLVERKCLREHIYIYVHGVYVVTVRLPIQKHALLSTDKRNTRHYCAHAHYQPGVLVSRKVKKKKKKNRVFCIRRTRT